ncbi:uncharacterized protein LOC111942408 [Cyanistes caeruleus]|uniref:uncharacterized protein LOC111942408 n=1 Tax=Cyanistes caeruleus TaxID=156563 RepID=UPI000CDA954B|nr:uncharacterized protein LOC111942408 [Cyanistes caeruleus]
MGLNETGLCLVNVRKPFIQHRNNVETFVDSSLWRRRAHETTMPRDWGLVPKLSKQYAQLFCLPPTFGKLTAEREWRPRPDTSCCRDVSATSCLQPATAGSLGLDLAAAIKTTLMTTHPVRIPTGVYGPIKIRGQVYGGLLLGRSSISVMGLFVLPGVIDADYTGEIQIMAYTLYPPITVEAGQRIAQFIPLPQTTKGIQTLMQGPRNNQGFGSSGIAMLTMDLNSRPKKKKYNRPHLGSTWDGLLPIKLCVHKNCSSQQKLSL